jgi:hypothetical protein
MHFILTIFQKFYHLLHETEGIERTNKNLLRFAFSAARMKSSKVKSIVLQSEKKNIE